MIRFWGKNRPCVCAERVMVEALRLRTNKQSRRFASPHLRRLMVAPQLDQSQICLRRHARVVLEVEKGKPVRGHTLIWLNVTLNELMQDTPRRSSYATFRTRRATNLPP